MKICLFNRHTTIQPALKTKDSWGLTIFIKHPKKRKSAKGVNWLTGPQFSCYKGCAAISIKQIVLDAFHPILHFVMHIKLCQHLYVPYALLYWFSGLFFERWIFVSAKCILGEVFESFNSCLIMTNCAKLKSKMISKSHCIHLRVLVLLVLIDQMLLNLRREATLNWNELSWGNAIKL